MAQCFILILITQQYHICIFLSNIFQIGIGSRTDPLSDRLLIGALSATSSPAYHRLYREPQTQSGSE